MSRGPIALGLAGIALVAVLGLAAISAAQEGGETGISVPAALAPPPWLCWKRSRRSGRRMAPRSITVR